MSLIAREMRRPEDGERLLCVACPQRIDPTPIAECAQCELCEGLDLDGVVAVRCGVAPADLPRGAASARAPVRTIMTAPVVCVEADAAIENVRWLLVSRNIGAVPVMDRHGRPIGIVSKLDLLRDRDERTVSVQLGPRMPGEPGLRTERIEGATAEDVMTPVVRAVLEHASIASAAATMAREHLHHLVVVSEAGKVCGMLSSLDVVRWVAAMAG